ncbi:protein Tob2-like [Amphiura filiformis]|uniref:protein Tob2-like n=1 Tax=Amphiura filiformis TaxID=82378 RepID=UPI003B223F96
MKPELASAINFILGHLYNKLPRRRVDIFAEELEKAMEMKFAGHWYPGYPNKGSGYRSLRVSQTLLDPAIAIAIHESGLNLDDIVSNLPEDLMVWVDPGEVSYRVGEKGIVTVIYKDKTKQESHQQAPVVQDATSPSTSPTPVSIPSPVTVPPVTAPVSNAHVEPTYVEPTYVEPSYVEPPYVEPPPLVAPIPQMPPQAIPTTQPQPLGAPPQLMTPQEFNYNPEAKEFLPMDGLTSSLGNMQLGSPGSTLGYQHMGQLGFNPIAPPMPVQKPRPVSAPGTSRPSSLTFTAASFAQTKFGSTKLKSSGKRVNFQQLSPTEFANYMKQRSAMKSFRGQRSPVNTRDISTLQQTSKEEAINGWLDHSMAPNTTHPLP